MGSFGDFGKREKKKKKQGQGSGGVSFSSRPVFVQPVQIKKEKREK